VRREHIVLLLIVVGFVTLVSRPTARSVVPPFPTGSIHEVYESAGDLVAAFDQVGDDHFTMTISPVHGARVTRGWAGVCVQNGSTVDLTNFTAVSAVVEPSVPVTMDVKLERTRHTDGTVLLLDHGRVAGGKQALTRNLRAADELGSGTLGDTRRMCFLVLADRFPRTGENVVVKISKIRFDRPTS
jgi:hypothetical protein